MSEEIVRCPYCVMGSEFRPMLQQSAKKKYFVCASCGHMATPEDPYLKCPCLRCREVNRIAITRRRGSEDPQKSEPLDLPLRP